MDNLEKLFTKHRDRRRLIWSIRTTATFAIGLSIFLLSKSNLGAVLTAAVPAGLFAGFSFCFATRILEHKYSTEEVELITGFDVELASNEVKGNLMASFTLLLVLPIFLGMSVDAIFPLVIFCAFFSLSVPYLTTFNPNANGIFLIGSIKP